MSVDIKQIADAIIANKDNPDELSKLQEQYQKEITALNDKAKIADEVSEKGVFKQLKEAQAKLDDIEKAKKTAEENELIEKGKNKELAEKYKTEKDALEARVNELSGIAEKHINYEKSRKDSLMGKITDPKHKKIAELLPTLEALEEYVELHTESSPNGGSGNHKGKQQEEQPLINYKTMK
jgi:hypothetical protein